MHTRTARWAVYCRRDLAERIGAGVIDTLPFAGFDDDYGPPSARRWIEANVRPERLAARVNSTHCLLEMAAHGFGGLPVPCFLGEHNPGRSGSADLQEWDLGLWILTHSDLRRSARVRAFMDFAGAELAKHRRTIEGVESE